jgi:phosphoglycolate phosphatase-like HAD superfamily hydrolase
LTSAARLVLWDIDHTLISTEGIGREIYREAFEQTTGQPLQRQADPTGRTEPEIFRDTVTIHGIQPSDQLFAKFADALAAGHRAKLPLLQQRGHALPGALQALQALHETPGVIQSVLTGNIKPVAIIKLAAFGLDPYLDFQIGAYGSDDPVRANLVEIARRRANHKYRLAFDESSTVLIGDTPSDIATAHQGGASIIAIASGQSDAPELRTAGAEVVLPDLTDTTILVNVISSGS